MPELVTKYPGIALSILRDAKLNCGTGVTPKILIDCPKQNFCSLPTGELCIYNVKDMTHTAQLHLMDFYLLPPSIVLVGSLSLMVFLLGVLLGRKLR